ncbi:MAG: hypothetical protein WBX03_08010 [Terriglobales bacterium]|jgi:hypothetical protein
MRKNALVVCLAVLAWAGNGFAQEPAAAIVKPVGTVKAIAGNAITLTTDAGAAVNVVVGESTRILRTAPGQKDLKGATQAQLQDVQVGDRILARGTASSDGGSVLATAIIVMKAADIASKQQRERDDWQKRGMGGLVTAIDAANGNITISISTLGGSKAATVHVAKETVVRRYAPDSVKFDDAKPGTLDQIKAGDQLRARGTKNADGSELAAEEIVSGTFRNVAGTVISTDASKQEINVMDLATKKPMMLKIGTDSQLRELPAMMAQRIAMRLKGGSAEDAPGAGGAPTAKPGEGSAGGGNGGSRSGGGRGDFQQMLGRLPAVTVADLQKGAAVMIVATEGTATNSPTAITLLTGVEPILTASPKGGQAAMLLSPWNLSGAGGEAAGGGNP